MFGLFHPENLEQMSLSDNWYMPAACNLQQFSTQLPVSCVLSAKTRGLVLYKHRWRLLSAITWCHTILAYETQVVCNFLISLSQEYFTGQHNYATVQFENVTFWSVCS